MNETLTIKRPIKDVPKKDITEINSYTGRNSTNPFIKWKAQWI